MFFHFLQATANTDENFRVHLNQPAYVVGETIWYKIYQTNYRDFPTHSEVVYFNLHDQSGKLLIQQKHKLTNGMTFGSLDIPISYDEDFYYLTCFTKWNLHLENSPLKCVQIPIFNPFQNSSSTAQSEPVNIHLDAASHQSDINIAFDQESYSRRDKVTVNISSQTQKNYQLSVSVHALNQLMPKPEIVSGVGYDIIAATEKEKALMIEGILTVPGTDQLVTSNVISIYKVGSNEFFKTASTSGEIQFTVKDFENTSRYQIFNMNPYQKAIPTFELGVPGKKLNGIPANEFARNPAINRFLKDITVSQKVNEIFYSKNQDSLQMNTFQPIGLVPDKVYRMEKYQLMKTFEDFIREVVVYAKLKKIEDEFTVRLRNRETNRDFMEKPWYLVDGYLTRDEQAVLSIPFKNLKRVELYNTKKSILGQLETVMIRSGLIVIYTNNNHLMQHVQKHDNIFDFNGFASYKEFENRQITSQDQKGTPVFRHTLYWNADISLANDTTISFYATDTMGDYAFEIVGIDDNGQIIEASKSFTVGY